MSEEKRPEVTLRMLIKAAVPIIAHSLAPWRPSIAWLTAAFIAVATAGRARLRKSMSFAAPGER